MTDAYFDRKHLPLFGSVGRGHAALASKFFEYYGLVFQPGKLSVREKSLTALAVAHAVQCPYCIDAYTSGSLEAGADLEQMTEAVHVVAAVRQASVLSFGMQMLSQAASLTMGEGSLPVTDGYFSKSHLRSRHALDEVVPEVGRKALDYAEAAGGEGALSPSLKSLIALAVAHVIPCPYSIDVHTRACVQHGLTLEAMSEAVHVAVAIRAGAALVHAVQMLEHYDEAQ